MLSNVYPKKALFWNKKKMLKDCVNKYINRWIYSTVYTVHTVPNFVFSLFYFIWIIIKVNIYI